MEHCAGHEQRGDLIAEIQQSTETIKAERRTERLMIGAIVAMAGVISGICVWLFNDNLSTLRTDIKEIKAYIATGSIADVSTKAELDNIKFRLLQLEQKR